MKFNCIQNVKKVFNTITTMPGAAFCAGAFYGVTVSCFVDWFSKKIYEKGRNDCLKEIEQKIQKTGLFVKGVLDAVTVNTDAEEPEKGPNTTNNGEEPSVMLLNEKKKKTKATK